MMVIELCKTLYLQYVGKGFVISLTDYKRDHTTVTAAFDIKNLSKPEDFHVSTQLTFDLLLEDGVCLKDTNPVAKQTYCFIIDNLIEDQEIVRSSLNLLAYPPFEDPNEQKPEVSYASHLATVLAWDIHQAYVAFIDVCEKEISDSGMATLVEQTNV
ncbi:MAG TPA: hypothetical protein VK133_00740 [Amoebophilaceae bacterium]|jgi:hypothetical protein|nr:hypothetical protein [Amoebophilaceae bacterium]